MTRSTGQGIVNFVNLPNRFQAKGWPINRFTVATTIQSPTLVTPVLSPFANDKQPADRPRVICIEVRSSFVRPPAVLPNHRRKTREIPSRAGARLAPSTTTPVPILLPRPRPFPPPFLPPPPSPCHSFHTTPRSSASVSDDCVQFTRSG